MGFLENCHYYWIENADQRLLDLPLAASAYEMPLLLFAYLYFVLRWGPRFMENRQPYSLKIFIKLYNIVQIVANALLIYEEFDAGLFTYSLICTDLDYSTGPKQIKLARCVWYYFMLKLLDYVETIIFVLRKKNNQVSGLHLYHHISTSMLAWMAVRYYAIVPAVYLAMYNNVVHVIMYTYYFLSAYGPNIQKVIRPIKPWITILQMAQFVLLMMYVSQNFISSCKRASHVVALLFEVNLVINFYMFYNFYRNTYVKPKGKVQ